MSGKMNLDACVGWLGEVSYVVGKWGVLGIWLPELASTIRYEVF